MRTLARVVTIAAVLTLTACGGVEANNEKPANAAFGFFDALDSDKPERACSFIDVSGDEREECRDAFSSGEFEVTVDGFEIGDVTTDGDRALVTIVTDEICFDEDCISNDDEDEGQPRPRDSFDDAYDEAQEDEDSPVVPMVREDGKWYVNLG